MKQYLDLLKDVMENGSTRGDRTGTGTISVFGRQTRYDLSKGFPMVTTKKLHWKSIVVELLWFLQGSGDVKFLEDNGVTIWKEWTAEVDGIRTVGPMYPSQWCDWIATDRETGDWYSINQIEKLVNDIKTKPTSRRLIVSAWNPADMPDESISPIENVKQGKPALTSCHNFFQCYVREGKLDMMVNIRSNDLFLGAPFNIASYALLTHMLAQQCNLNVGDLVITIGDAHIYQNHLEQVELQLTRVPLTLPRLVIKRKPNTIFDYKIEDFEIKDYHHYEHIKGKISV